MSKPAWNSVSRTAVLLLLTSLLVGCEETPQPDATVPEIGTCEPGVTEISRICSALPGT
jgi:hypothetical protein